MIDTHCHLTFPDFEGRTHEVLARAAEHDVTGVITVSTTTQDCHRALQIAKTHPRIWCTAGVHPLYSDKGPHEWALLRQVAEHPKCVAWGELGLDNHYDRPPRDLQHRVLAEQIAFIEGCRRDHLDLPVVLHCRKAFDDLIPILDASALPNDRFVFHCFTGTPADARKVLDFGAMISFTGVVTYKNAPEVREAAKLVPIDRMMVETDAPFLSPEPERTTRPCEPWMTSLTAKSLANTLDIPFEDLHPVLNDNTQRFYDVA